MMKFLAVAWAFVGAICAATSPVMAQSYPNRPIQLVVPFPPGGGGDFTGRLIADRLSERLGQSVVVDNKPGGNTLIGAQAVARAAPDGYTLLMTTNQTLAANPNLYHRLPYDPIKDFAPISVLITAQLVLAVNPSVPVHSLRELIDLAKSKPGALSYASTGPGSETHLNMVLFAKAAGIDILHVPYRGGAPATTALLAGDVPMALLGFQQLRGHIAEGKVRPLAAGERIPALPNIPTITEVAGSDFLPLWIGLLAPGGTPADIVTRLNHEIREILKEPKVLERLSGVGYRVVGNSPDEFAKFLAEQKSLWGSAIKQAGVPMIDSAK